MNKKFHLFFISLISFWLLFAFDSSEVTATEMDAGRVITEVEYHMLNDYIDGKLANNPNYKVDINTILDELGLSDVSTLQADENESDNNAIINAVPNLGSIYFRNANSNSSTFNATLYLSNIGFDPLDLVFGTVKSWSNISGSPGSYVLTGSEEFIETSLRIGVTSIGTYNASHFGHGARLSATATIEDGGKVVVPNPAAVTYSP